MIVSLISAAAQTSSTQSPTPSQSLSPALSVLFDNTADKTNALLSSAGNLTAVSPVAVGGVAFRVLNTDPVCGPGKWALTLLELGLATSSGSAASASLAFQLFRANASTLTPVAGSLVCSFPAAALAVLGSAGWFSVTPSPSCTFDTDVAGTTLVLTVSSTLTSLNWASPDDGRADHAPVSGAAVALAALTSSNGGGVWATQARFPSIRATGYKMSCGATPTQTPTPSVTPSQTPSSAATSSGTASISQSGSLTPSATGSASTTVTPTASSTPSPTGTRSNTASQTASGFPPQTMLDNTNALYGAISASATRVVNSTAARGIVIGFPEADPVCGPGRYDLLSLTLALSAPSAGSVTLTFEIFSFVWSTWATRLTGTTTVGVELSTSPSFVTLTLGVAGTSTPLVADTLASPTHLLVWYASAPVLLHDIDLPLYNGAPDQNVPASGLEGTGVYTPVLGARVDATETFGADPYDVYPALRLVGRKTVCSPSPTPTQTTTPSTSQTPSVSGSASVSGSTSQTATPSVSASVSSSPSESQSHSPSPLGTPSQSSSLSSSQSGTPSNFRTPSGTGSSSGTASRSPTQTPTLTQSGSATATPSASTSLSQVVTPSATPSQAVSLTRTPSQTASGFPQQVVVDNTARRLGDIDGSSTFVLSGGTWRGVLLGWPEDDPGCGPGKYVLENLFLPLSASAATAVTLFASLYFTSDPATFGSSMVVGSSFAIVNVGTSADFVKLSLLSQSTPFVVDTVANPHYYIVFWTDVPVSWHGMVGGGWDATSFAVASAPLVYNSSGSTLGIDPGGAFGGILLTGRKTVCSPTPTQSQSPSATPSLTLTSTQSPSQSGSPSLSETRSGTSTATLTGSASGSRTASQTPTASGSPSATGTRSQTPTPSESETQTATMTTSSSQTGSASQTQTFSGTATASQSTSLSQTQSASQTPTSSNSPTPSLSQSRSQSGTASSSLTSSATLTQSQSRSGSGTPTVTLSASQSLTASETQSRSGTVTASPTATGSQSSTASRTPTASPSRTPSESASASETETASESRTTSVTGTPSASPTASETQSVSLSSTPSPTVTASPSPTRSQTQSRSQTNSRSGSLSGSQTATASVSSSPSESGSPSPTSSATLTLTGSASGTASSTLTASSSETMSQSPSLSLTPSATGSQTQGASQTSSATQSRTPSSSQTGSFSATASESGTRSVSQSASVSETASQTASPSPTQSPSQTPTRSATGTPSQAASRSSSGTSSETTTPSPTGASGWCAAGGSHRAQISTLCCPLLRGITCTGSPSLSATPSLSQSLTRSQTQTQTRSQTASGTPSMTTSPSATSTASTTQTSTRTPSVSASTLPWSCFDGVQVMPPPLARCSTSGPFAALRPPVQDFGETDVDCGGGAATATTQASGCLPCVEGRACAYDTDCDGSVGASDGTILTAQQPLVVCRIPAPNVTGVCTNARAVLTTYDPARAPVASLQLSVLVLGVPPRSFSRAAVLAARAAAATVLSSQPPASGLAAVAATDVLFMSLAGALPPATGGSGSLRRLAAAANATASNVTLWAVSYAAVDVTRTRADLAAAVASAIAASLPVALNWPGLYVLASALGDPQVSALLPAVVAAGPAPSVSASPSPSARANVAAAVASATTPFIISLAVLGGVLLLAACVAGIVALCCCTAAARKKGAKAGSPESGGRQPPPSSSSCCCCCRGGDDDDGVGEVAYVGGNSGPRSCCGRRQKRPSPLSSHAPPPVAGRRLSPRTGEPGEQGMLQNPMARRTAVAAAFVSRSAGSASDPRRPPQSRAVARGAAQGVGRKAGAAARAVSPAAATSPGFVPPPALPATDAAAAAEPPTEDSSPPSSPSPPSPATAAVVTGASEPVPIETAAAAPAGGGGGVGADARVTGSPRLPSKRATIKLLAASPSGRGGASAAVTPRRADSTSDAGAFSSSRSEASPAAVSMIESSSSRAIGDAAPSARKAPAPMAPVNVQPASQRRSVAAFTSSVSPSRGGADGSDGFSSIGSSIGGGNDGSSSVAASSVALGSPRDGPVPLRRAGQQQPAATAALPSPRAPPRHVTDASMRSMTAAAGAASRAGGGGSFAFGNSGGASSRSPSTRGVAGGAPSALVQDQAARLKAMASFRAATFRPAGGAL